MHDPAATGKDIPTNKSPQRSPTAATATAYGSCVRTWVSRSQPHAIALRMVESENGEQWSPKTDPGGAPTHMRIRIDWLRGMLIQPQYATTRVRQQPVENRDLAPKMEIDWGIALSSLGTHSDVHRISAYGCKKKKHLDIRKLAGNRQHWRDRR